MKFALIREQKAFIENTIAVYRMAFPDDTSIYLPFVRESEHDPGEIILGIIQLAGETDTIRQVAASLASLLVQWEVQPGLLK